jgi:ECF sigma factor
MSAFAPAKADIERRAGQPAIPSGRGTLLRGEESSGARPMENDQAQPNDTSLILLERFRDGDEFAAEALFSRYFDRLTSLARSRLSARLASRTDPEDIVMSVYRSFFMGARAGRFEISGGRSLAAAGVDHKAQIAPKHPTPWSRPPVDQCRAAVR